MNMETVIQGDGYRVLSGDTCLIKFHQDLIDFVKPYGGIVNMAASDVVLFIDNCSDELAEKIKSLPPELNYLIHNGNPPNFDKWDDTLEIS